jgi:hypothetical protein
VAWLRNRKASALVMAAGAGTGVCAGGGAGGGDGVLAGGGDVAAAPDADEVPAPAALSEDESPHPASSAASATTGRTAAARIIPLPRFEWLLCG